MMYCSTSEGKKSLVRQMSAELHIETDPSIVEQLQRFMNKFHLIRTNREMKNEVEKLGKEHSEKILTFRSADSYASKLIQGFR